MVLNLVNNRRETALLAQKYIDENKEFVCTVAPFENKIIYPKFIHGKTYKIQVYGYPGHHGRNKSRILSAANVIKSIELGCSLSDKIYSRITFKDNNLLNYHLDNINIHFLEYQKEPYKLGIVLGMHLGDPNATKQCKRRPRAIVTEQNGFSHETMYYRYVYETYLGKKLDDNVEVDHIDGNIRNNSISNLRIVSLEENRLKSKLCEENKTIVGKRYFRYKCSICGKVFDREVDYNLPEERIPKIEFCSSKCNRIYYSMCSKEMVDCKTETLGYEYYAYNYLKTCLNAGPVVFGNTVSCVRSYNPQFVFPIVSEIDKLINDPSWHDVLYYTYSNQIKIGVNKKEAPEVIDKMAKFIQDYEAAKSQQYIFNMMNNCFVYIPIMLPNMYKFQSDKGVTTYDISGNSKYINLKKNDIIPEIHQFKI